MNEKELYFVIPTYRLRDVSETIEEYDEHFWRNGHAVRMIIFDDSSPANQENTMRALNKLKPITSFTTSARMKKIDSAMDLETNATKGLARENSLMLQHGGILEHTAIKMAQTFRSGTNDIDAIDYVEMFLDDHGQTNLDTVNDLYVLANFRPVVTKENWRMDCGVAGYDNTFEFAEKLH